MQHLKDLVEKAKSAIEQIENKSLSTLDAEEAKNKLTEENKKVKILKPQNEDPFYYWNM